MAKKEEEKKKTMANFLQYEMKITTTNLGRTEDANQCLVVFLSIVFGSDYFSEITFTIWDQRFKEA